MDVTFDKSFSKSLDKIHNKQVLSKTEEVIVQCENATALKEISNLKKLKGYKTYYRIKIGEYRIGVEITSKDIHFIIPLPPQGHLQKISA